ncbi:hypothetical protein RF11_06264 [Thelohanellus kitauei]|uniref:FANCI solenoid 4 domain-containing protein n=1 Tax=Thelohanellus kitauei TaxID=669202 RepID=A0A0C2IDD4_THEKT|nr:hypothetical protein RF11_06264 [Thelohanellus kitauei]
MDEIFSDISLACSDLDEKKIMTYLINDLSKIETDILNLSNRCKLVKLMDFGKSKQPLVDRLTLKETPLIVKNESNDEICDELLFILGILDRYTAVFFGPDFYVSLCRALETFYMTLSSYLKCQKELFRVKSIDSLSIKSENLVINTTKDLTSKVHEIMAHLGSNEMKENTENLKSTKRKTSFNPFQELRLIPNLVYAVENFEKEVTTLSKMASNDLTVDFKSNVARDFKIDFKKIES